MAVKMHDLKLTNAACVLLKDIVPLPNWYEGQSPAVALRAIEVVENLADHVPPDESDEKWPSAEKILTVTEGQREALKVAVQFFLKKAAFRLTPHVRAILIELGLAGQE